MRLKANSWVFQKNEEVELYWFGAPFLNHEGLWMIKCLFKRADGTFREQSFPFGTLPHLRIGLIYINGDFAEKTSTGSLFEVKVSDSTRFEICKGFDFPKSLYAFNVPPSPSYGNLPVCRFEAGGIIYYLPCTEIVRSILAPYQMLANQILRPEGLDCFIESSFSYRSKLKLHLTDEYHQKLLNDDAISYFVWLKFNFAAVKAWTSVYKNMVLDATQTPGQDVVSEFKRGIPIRVIPPVNDSSKWTFRGLQYNNHRLILELLFRSDLEAPFQDIEVFHPRLDRSESDGSIRYKKDPNKEPSDNQDIELETSGEAANRKKNHNIIEQPPTMFSFMIKPRIYKKRKIAFSKHTGETVLIGADNEIKNYSVTAQDWTQEGKTPQIEFSSLQQVDASLAKGLEDFLKLIEYIQMNYRKLIISYRIITLPYMSSFAQYADGSYRTIALVKIAHLGLTPSFIIEVARADGWSISTLIIKPSNTE
jgi:hypothetical protein